MCLLSRRKRKTKGKTMNKPEKEVRALPCKIELRAEDGASPLITGYAALYGVRSENLGGFREVIMSGAFDEAAARDDVRALINHDSNHVLGRTTSGTLRLLPDAKGLGVEITPPNTQAARDLVELMRRGDVTQMSFSFSIRTEDQRWSQPAGENGEWLREVTRIDRLYDVAVVTYPAYPQASAAVRALQQQKLASADVNVSRGAYARSRLLNIFRTK